MTGAMGAVSSGCGVSLGVGRIFACSTTSGTGLVSVALSLASCAP
jgi:hypothetical protein